jgi:hypothetical protein
MRVTHHYCGQMSTMGWSAIVLWIINIVAAVCSGFQDEGAIKQSLDAEKLNHDALIFCASCFVCACLLYSNVSAHCCSARALEAP